MDTEKSKLMKLFIKYDVDEKLADEISSILADNAYSTEDLELLCEIDHDDLVYMKILPNADQKIILNTLKKIAAENSIPLVSSKVTGTVDESLCSRLRKLSEQMQNVNNSLKDIEMKAKKSRTNLKEILSDLSAFFLGEQTPVDPTERKVDERFFGSPLESSKYLDESTKKRKDEERNTIDEVTEGEK